MTIFLDATEAREGTRLPQAVISAGEVVIGLESLTGADFIISPLSEPKLPSTLRDCAPHRSMLAKHTRAGVLVQRKSGTDLLNSIPDLASIEQRMLEWSGRIGPYLLVTGVWEPSRGGKLLLNGQHTQGGYTYKSLLAALDWWQVRGGNVATLANDGCITSWTHHWHEQMLHKLGGCSERVVLDLPPAQTLTADSPWWVSLASIDGIGPVRAQAIAEWLPDEWQSMVHALRCLVDMENVNLPGKPTGVGPKTVRAVREWLGIEHDEEIRIVKRKEPL